MVSTTRTERSGGRGVRRLAAAACGLLAGCCLTVMAAPIVAGSAAALPGDTIARDLRKRAAIDEEQLLTLIATRSRAIERYGALEWRRELATASVVRRGGGPLEPAVIDRSMAQTRMALEEGPASPQDWLRLSMLEAMKGNRPAAAGHLSTALLTGADMPRLRSGVVDVGFALWRDLSAETRVSTLTALRHAWQADDKRKRRALLTNMRDRGFLPLARMALSQEDGLQETLDKL
jgi:hypothetical protein